MDPSWRKPLTILCPRGLGDAVVAARIGAALARSGRDVGVRVKGDVQWMEEGLPALPGVGKPSDDADLLDLCNPPRMQGWDYSDGSRLHHTLARRAGLDPEALPDGPWLRPTPWPGAQYGPYVVVAPEASTSMMGLTAEQVEAVCYKAVAVGQARCVIVNAEPLSGLPEEAEDLTGQTTLPELCSIIGGARAVVTVGTGPLHVAAACRVPLLAILGVNMSARGFWRDYRPTLWVQSPTRPGEVPASLVGEMCHLLLGATEQPPVDLQERAQWAHRQQGQIDYCAAQWQREKSPTTAKPVTAAGTPTKAARSGRSRAKRSGSAKPVPAT